MMPRDHFSWSQLDCYTRDPGMYFTRYVMGIQEPATLPMRLGSIVHEAIAGTLSEKGWREALIELGFTPNYQRAIEQAIKTIGKPKQPEFELRAPFDGFQGPSGPIELLCFIDDLNGDEVVEYKTGAAWNQARVDQHGQLTFYALAHRIKFGKLPKSFTLHHINAQNGKVTTFRTKRTLKDVEQFRKKMLLPTLKLIDREVFHRV